MQIKIEDLLFSNQGEINLDGASFYIWPDTTENENEIFRTGFDGEVRVANIYLSNTGEPELAGFLIVPASLPEFADSKNFEEFMNNLQSAQMHSLERVTDANFAFREICKDNVLDSLACFGISSLQTCEEDDFDYRFEISGKLRVFLLRMPWNRGDLKSDSTYDFCEFPFLFLKTK